MRCTPTPYTFKRVHTHEHYSPTNTWRDKNLYLWRTMLNEHVQCDCKTVKRQGERDEQLIRRWCASTVRACACGCVCVCERSLGETRACAIATVKIRSPPRRPRDAVKSLRNSFWHYCGDNCLCQVQARAHRRWCVVICESPRTGFEMAPDSLSSAGIGSLRRRPFAKCIWNLPGDPPENYKR